MDFTFDEDQRLFQGALRDFLAAECRPEKVRALWESESGHDPELWARLAELGLPGLHVAEEHGGMGLDEIDSVLLFEELGRAALSEPVIATAAVAAPLLAELGDSQLASRWLPRIAAGQAIVVVGHEPSPLVCDAQLADLLLLSHGDTLYAVTREAVGLERQPANDPGRRLYTVRWQPAEALRVASGEEARALQAAALDRGALAASAALLGAGERLIELASDYARQRHQFGAPIGSFQAVKHLLADAKLKLEYARPAVARAAHSVARGVDGRGLHVSMAKLLAAEAGALAARTALQVHGAIGYTWEQDLHLWMRRVWSLEMAWGRSDFHRRRVAARVLADGARLGPGETFTPHAATRAAS